jgi:hypothetical protein
MMGFWWRSQGVRLEYAPAARAIHDHQHTTYAAHTYADHIYANLFDAVIGRPRPLRAFASSLLGFVTVLRGELRTPRTVPRFVAAWASGHLRFARDARRLRTRVRAGLPQPPAEAGQRPSASVP